MSAQESSAERMITITHSQTNRIAGFGILLPPRSIAPSTRTIIPFEGSAGAAEPAMLAHGALQVEPPEKASA